MSNKDDKLIVANVKNSFTRGRAVADSITGFSALKPASASSVTKNAVRDNSYAKLSEFKPASNPPTTPPVQKK